MKKLISVLSIAFCIAGNSYAQTDSANRNNDRRSTDINANPNMNNQSNAANIPTGNSGTAGSTKYFYYPESNVYFNEANSSYSYYDPATSTWTTNPKLPSTYSIDKNTPKNEINYNGTDIWTDNAAHQKKYGKPVKKVAPKP